MIKIMNEKWCPQIMDEVDLSDQTYQTGRKNWSERATITAHTYSNLLFLSSLKKQFVYNISYK